MKWRHLLVPGALLGFGCGSAAGPSGADAQSADAAAELDGTADQGSEVPPPSLDAEAPDLAPEAPPAPVPYPRPSYTLLSEAGLYQDIARRVIAAGLEEFRPTYTLWSDGAEKRRWVALPPGTKVDTSDMDRWIFPVGTRFWKEFSTGGVLLETRLVERYGTGPQDFWMGSFVWKADQSDAVFAVEGQLDINGTRHDAPARKDCEVCHHGEPGRALGFSAMQLSRNGDGLTLDALAAQGRLTDPPAAGTSFHPPGDPLAAFALGYLHANCGHCHNLKGTSWPDTQMVLRLETTDTVLEASDIYRTVVGQKLQYWRHDGFAQRVVPGDPMTSALMFRMQARGRLDQMPPLATELVDGIGVDLISRWITSLVPPAP